jgi:hypothetical protein
MLNATSAPIRALPVLQGLRASSMPLAFKCAAALRPEGVRINPANDAADVGTAAHECLQPLAERGVIEWDDIEGIAKKHGADPEETRILCALAYKLWPEVAESFRGALSEVPLSLEVAPGITLTGHVDLLTITDTVARAADWKTGRKDSDYAHQMKAYGALILLSDAQLTEVTITVLWVRDQEIENYTMNRAQARAWVRELLEKVVEWDGVYRPGRHCEYCQRSHECAAVAAMVRRDLAALADPELMARVDGQLAQMTPSEIVDVFDKADFVIGFAERVRAAVKSHVERTGDVVASGKRLTVVTETRREVDPLLAWPVLENAGFGDTDFAAAMTLSASKIEKRIAEKAGRGNGAVAVRAIKQALEDAHAVGSREIKKLQAKRA